jgi:multidrug efflux pump subunit AcrA (membrane-fusion protein)
MFARITANKYFVPSLIVLLSALVFALLFITKPAIEPVVSKEKVWRVAITTIDSRSHSPYITLFGNVISPNLTQIKSAISADVLTVTVKEGTLVKKDQVLITLNNDDAKLLLKQRKAELAEIAAQINSETSHYKNNQIALRHEQELLDLTEKEYQRTVSLERDKLATRSKIDLANQAAVKQKLNVNQRELAVADHQPRMAQLKARKARAEALRDLVMLDIRRSQISAPFSGMVTKVHTALGNRARAGDLLIELYNNDSIEVRAHVPTIHVGNIQSMLATGSKITATSHVRQQRVELLLDRMSGKIEQGTGGLDLFFNILTPDHNLQLGRSLEIDLQLAAQDNAFAIPREALYGSDRIYQLLDNRMKSRIVKRIGETRLADNRQLILVQNSELHSGDKIITTQLPNAIDGLLVQVIHTLENNSANNLLENDLQKNVATN